MATNSQGTEALANAIHAACQSVPLASQHKRELVANHAQRSFAPVASRYEALELNLSG